MASKTDIANLALQRIGAKRIMDIDDTTSKGARTVRNVFEASVRKVSRLHKWTSLMDRAELGQLVDKPAFGWDLQYQLPADYIRIVEFNRIDVWSKKKELFTIEGSKLLTNEETAKIRYVRYVEDSTQYDDLFIEALAVEIASKIAVPIRQDEGLASELRGEFRTISLPDARRVDSNEKKKTQWNPVQESRFIKARRISTNG